LNRRLLSALLFLLSGAVFLYLGLRSEPRQTVWLILGPVFLVFGLARLARGRSR
jgi:hypothetical protein